MFLKEVKVENFRMLKCVDIPLCEKEDDELSLIVGKNNTGKTSLLKVLKRMLPYSSRSMFEWDDFNIDYQQELFELFMGDNSMEEAKRIGVKLTIHIEYSNNDSFDVLRNFMMDLDEESNTIKIKCCYDIKLDQFNQLKEDLQRTESNSFQDFISFMRRNVNKYFETKYYALSPCGDYREEVKSSEIRKLIRLRSINANRDISNKESDHSLSNISERLYKLIENSEEDQFINLQKAIHDTDTNLTESYSTIFSDVVEAAGNFGAADNDMIIEILSTIKDKNLLKDNTTLFYKKEDTYLPESYNGLGYLNLIGMIFEIEAISKEFEKLNQESKGLNLLFIEEPEVHTHPQLQYVFIKNIKKLLKTHGEKNVQTIMTTHSSHILSKCNFNDVIYLSRDNNAGTLAKAFRDIEVEFNGNGAFKFVKKHLYLTRAELFFAEKAILIEGDTERILMRAMMERVDKVESDHLPLLSQNISIVEVGSYAHIFEPLLEFLNIKALIITDLDYGKINESNRVTKCDYNDASCIGNTTITQFLNKDKEELEEIIDLENEKKIVKQNKLRLAYQTRESGICADYPGRSFEEAFININFEYINKNKEEFSSLKNSDDFIAEKSPYELAKNCIDEKTTFATDLLYFDDESGSWEIPKYIEEGLLWLKEI